VCTQALTTVLRERRVNPFGATGKLQDDLVAGSVRCVDAKKCDTGVVTVVEFLCRVDAHEFVAGGHVQHVRNAQLPQCNDA